MRRWPLILSALLIAAIVWAALEYHSFFHAPTNRLPIDGSYADMPPDSHHRYLSHPIDHSDTNSGIYKGFYLLSTHFRRGGPVVFFLTDGQMELVAPRPDFAFFDDVLGDLSYVLIGHRGHAPTLFPEVYRPDGTLDHAIAMRLYGSDQQVEDIEQVRLDLLRSGDLPPDGRIMLFGASGAGVLAQQYLSRYGEHVSRAVLAVTGAPDLARAADEPYSPDFREFNPEGARLLDALLLDRSIDLPALANVLYQAGRARPDARAIQLSILRDLAAGGSLLKYKLTPQQNLELVKFLMSAPSAAAVKVRWYELVGQDLEEYRSSASGSMHRSSDSIRLNLLYEFSSIILADFIKAERAGQIQAKAFHIDRSTFSGEVLVMAGTQDVVFSPRIARAIARAYPRGRLALFDDGHRLSRSPDYYRSLRTAFFAGGFNSPDWLSLLQDARQLEH